MKDERGEALEREMHAGKKERNLHKFTRFTIYFWHGYITWVDKLVFWDYEFTLNRQTEA